MIHSLIIDDETDGGEALKVAIERYCPEVAIKGIYVSPQEGVEAIKYLKPELVFLDVQMPQMSGFDVLQELSPVNFEVIFVSAYDKYAIKAIKFSALDYLLKPVDIDDLIHAVSRVKQRLQKENNTYRYQSVLNNIQYKSRQIDKLAVPTLEGIELFNTADIIYCKAEGNYTVLFLRNKESKMICRNLKDFENLLAEPGFCRVHHAALVNMQHIQKYVKGEGGYVILTDGHHVDVSRRKKEEFLLLLNRL